MEGRDDQDERPPQYLAGAFATTPGGALRAAVDACSD